MNTSRQIFSTTALPVLMCCASHLAAANPVDATAAAAGKTPAQVCEAAVTEAIQKARGQNARQVQFAPPKRAANPTAAAQTSVGGNGRYQGVAGAMPFTYSCAFDPQSHETVGVIFKDTGEPKPRAAEKPWNADLTNLSPKVCESAAAVALSERFPRAVNIVLSSQSRQLKPAPNAHTYLHGQGSLSRAAGMGATAFTYRCELDTGTGKLVGMQTDLVN